MAATVPDAARAWARGNHPSEAGVELLIFAGKIKNGYPWVHVTLADPISGFPELAEIDVDELLDNSGVWSGGEQRLVRIAASLLGGPAVDLSENLSGLDRDMLEHVLAAVAHAGGSHEQADFVSTPDGRYQFTALPSLYPWPK